MSDKVRVCPDCDDADIEVHVGGNVGGDYNWRCWTCGGTFETPDTRPPEGHCNDGHSKLKKVGFEGFTDE